MDFGQLIKKISPILKRITHRLNGRFTFFNEEDLYQEAMEHLWVDWQEGKLQDKTESYILQGCYFCLKNYMRKNSDKRKLVRIDNTAEGQDDEDSYSLESFLPQENSILASELAHYELLVEQIRNNDR